MRLFLIAVFLIVTPFSLAQSDDVAKKVYENAQDSVFLVYLNDSNGKPTAFGSAFVVAPRTLITNAHVVDAGEPVLAVGPVRIPVKVLRIDTKNDLAILSVTVDLTSSPLPLSRDSVKPGEHIFAIGNPEGLEKSISEGIVSGIRNTGERDLLQITSPISHGSSGGPILNARGEVVGVAVAILADGQNLNFAVPISHVRSLLDSPSVSDETRHTAAEVVAIESKKASDEFSNDENSPYQMHLKELVGAMRSALLAARDETDLNQLACVGATDDDVSDEGIAAAKRLVIEHPSPDAHALLSYVLYQRANTEYYKSIFAKDGGPEKMAAGSNRDRYLDEANHEASLAIGDAKSRRLPIAVYVAASVDEDRKNYIAAIQKYSTILSSKPEVCGFDIEQAVLKGLIADSNNLNRAADAERWFRQFASEYNPQPYDWDSEGDRRYAAKDYVATADAYERAARASNYYVTDYCYAAVNRYLQPITDGDSVLADGRACVDSAAKNTNKDKESEYKEQLPIVYRLMASVLDDRGVYQSALAYIKESLGDEPNNDSSLHTEATIYEHLHQYGECVAAEKAAISASDGKFAYMQFRLGNCYFDQEEWSLAESSFRLAANADKTDASSAYDLALSLERQGYGGDARAWYSEALKRNPSAELKTKILNAMSK